MRLVIRIHDYIFYQGIKAVENKDDDSGAIYFRGH